MNKLTLMLARANKFNKLIEPILDQLSGDQKDLAHYFLVGHMSSYIPVKETEKLVKVLEEEFIKQENALLRCGQS